MIVLWTQCSTWSIQLETGIPYKKIGCCHLISVVSVEEKQTLSPVAVIRDTQLE